MIIQSKQKLILIMIILLSTTASLGGVLRVLADTNEKVAGTIVGGVLATDTTWTVANSPYVVTETVRISSGISLTIEAGVTIKYDSSVYVDFAALDVEAGGHLEAVGTAVNPIIFTSLQDSAPGEWVGIVIVGSANLQQARFRYGVRNVDIWGASDEPIVIQDSLFSDSSGVGMGIAVEALHRVQLSNLEFANNVQNRIKIIRYSDAEQLIDDVILKPMIGLDGYWFEPDNGISPFFSIPDGITLTLQAGTTLMMSQGSLLDVQGRLWADGDVDNLVYFTRTTEMILNDEQWTGIVFGETGSGLVTFTEIDHADVAVGVFGANGGAVVISDSKIANGSIGIVSTPASLHRLQMNNVLFENNESNRVALEVVAGVETFSQDVTLTAQPGLEGYEVFDKYDQIVIPEGVRLTIEPDVTFFITETMALQVEGRLQFQGTVGHTATLTSFDEGSSWKGVLLTNNGMMTSEYGEITRAETAVSIISPTATLSITHSVISQNGVGILANEGSLMMGCTAVTDNNIGIHIESGGNPAFDVQQNNISGNMVAGSNNESGSQIDARSNWWGDVSGPSGNGSGSGDAVLGNVLYDPWLAEYDCVDVYSTFLPFVIRP